jgi:hypothetical protein
MGECHRRDERAPIALDASNPVWPIASADGIICINMVHISPWKATLGLLKGAAAILPTGSPLYLYGPYLREGFATAPSNQAFDQSLRDRDPNWGLRDLEAVAATAQALGFSGPVITEMPANNLSVVFRRMRSVSLHGRDRPANGCFRNSHRARGSSLGLSRQPGSDDRMPEERGEKSNHNNAKDTIRKRPTPSKPDRLA